MLDIEFAAEYREIVTGIEFDSHNGKGIRSELLRLTQHYYPFITLYQNIGYNTSSTYIILFHNPTQIISHIVDSGRLTFFSLCLWYKKTGRVQWDPDQITVWPVKPTEP